MLYNVHPTLLKTNPLVDHLLTTRIVAQARILGFPVAAVSTPDPLTAGARFDEWLAEGRHGQMAYLRDHRHLRDRPADLEPHTRSLITVLAPYRHGPDLLEAGLRIARYAQGDDYHEVLRDRLRRLAAFIHAETGADVAARPATDSAPLLERDLAQSVGLGWIAKNTMLIHPELGSFTFIAELLVDLELAPSNLPTTPDRCGTCSRCLDACPTHAIVSPYVLDARRCISYLTIELRGPIPRHMRPLIGDHVYGCDVCQDVCPWNTHAPLADDPALAPRRALRSLSPEQLLQLDHASWARIFRGSAAKRCKHRGALRNAAVVLGNRRDPSLIPLLSARLSLEPEPLVRGHIAWALGRIEHPDARRALARARANEHNPYVLDEIEAALPPTPHDAS